jgi:Ca2+:H+ antiporter
MDDQHESFVRPGDPPEPAPTPPPESSDFPSRHVIGIRPYAPRSSLPLDAIEQTARRHVAPRICCFSNIIWAVLVGWWTSIPFAIAGFVFIITIYGFRHGIACFRLAGFIVFPFGRYLFRGDSRGPDNCFTTFIWIILFPLYGVPALIGMALSWETVYFIPMAKCLWSVIRLIFDDPTSIDISQLQGGVTQRIRPPVLIAYESGSWLYFRYCVMSFEVPYLNFLPATILGIVAGFAPVGNSIFGASMGIIGAVPCAYVIGICVDELSHQLGLVLGAILNSIFLTIVELILYGLSLAKGLADIVRSAVTGAFLMNLLIIPGFGMLAAGVKWKEVVLNKRSQAITGTFLLLSVTAVVFPSVFFHVHETFDYDCSQCNITFGSILDCASCNSSAIADRSKDAIYAKFGWKLMAVMAGGMPIIYVIGVVFSVWSHAHIYEVKTEVPHDAGPSGVMNKTVSLVILIFATVCFSLMAHVITDKIPDVLRQVRLSPRFVGLVFYTLIPNAAEYMNAVKFALNGNIGLSMEIGNQGAILTALVEFPALVGLSALLNAIGHKKSQGFTLVFPYIDVFCVMIAVLLRNSILTEKAINWFTGTSFLIIFLLISWVYFFEVF